MRRKILTFLFEFTYRHPLVARISSKLIFGEKPHCWRRIAEARIPLERKSTLELGCGMYPALNRGTILDLSLPLLDKVINYEGRSKVCASALSLPFKRESFSHALSIFPPGIAADNGFFQEERFWEELNRVLSPGGTLVAAVYVIYGSRFERLLARIIDPLPPGFWEKTKELAKGLKISKGHQVDPWGNKLIFVRARKAA